MNKDWKEFLKIAYEKAQESRNPSTQNSAILINDDGEVLVQAANQFPDNVAETNERQSAREVRHKFSVHAERNAVFIAARAGVKAQGLTMIAPWAACTDCAQSIIQAGIKRLVTHKQALDKSSHWIENIDLAFSMLKEAGVEVIIYDGKIGAGKIRREGQEWEP